MWAVYALGEEQREALGSLVAGSVMAWCWEEATLWQVVGHLVVKSSSPHREIRASFSAFCDGRQGVEESNDSRTIDAAGLMRLSQDKQGLNLLTMADFRRMCGGRRIFERGYLTLEGFTAHVGHAIQEPRLEALLTQSRPLCHDECRQATSCLASLLHVLALLALVLHAQADWAGHSQSIREAVTPLVWFTADSGTSGARFSTLTAADDQGRVRGAALGALAGGLFLAGGVLPLLLRLAGGSGSQDSCGVSIGVEVLRVGLLGLHLPVVSLAAWWLWECLDADAGISVAIFLALACYQLASSVLFPLLLNETASTSDSESNSPMQFFMVQTVGLMLGMAAPLSRSTTGAYREVYTWMLFAFSLGLVWLRWQGKGHSFEAIAMKMLHTGLSLTALTAALVPHTDPDACLMALAVIWVGMSLSLVGYRCLVCWRMSRLKSLQTDAEASLGQMDALVRTETEVRGTETEVRIPMQGVDAEALAHDEDAIVDAVSTELVLPTNTVRQLLRKWRWDPVALTAAYESDPWQTLERIGVVPEQMLGRTKSGNQSGATTMRRAMAWVGQTVTRTTRTISNNGKDSAAAADGASPLSHIEVDMPGEKDDSLRGRRKTTPVEEQRDEVECGVCFDEQARLEMIGCPEGHYFCKGCYTRYFSAMQDVRRMICMDVKCQDLVPKEAIRDLALPAVHI